MIGMLLVFNALQSDRVDTVLEPERTSGTCGKDPDEFQMPSGSFNETCRNCSLDYHVLVCTCLMQVDPLVSLHSRPNLTGEWTSGGNFSSVGDTFLFSLRSLHKIKMINVTDNSIAYQVTCFDGGQNRQKTCSPNLITKDGEYHPWEYWQSANITVRPGNTTMRLDNGSVLYGTIATDFNSVKWTYRNTSSSSGSDLPDPVVWVRRKFEKTGIRTSMSLKSCERVPMPSGSLGFNVTNENGYLTCDWTNKPPPRVGPYLHSLRGRWAIKRNCKTIASYTFFAPQFKNRGDPIQTFSLGYTNDAHQQKKACCQQCHSQKDLASTACEGWTITNIGTNFATCLLSSRANTAYPTSDDSTVSGYVLSADPATLCMARFESNTGFWGDTKMAEGINVAQLTSTNRSGAFPRWWSDGSRDRGTAWAFFPRKNASEPTVGRCSVPEPQLTQCQGPELNGSLLTANVPGQPWIVFVHGGSFVDFDGKDANYAETNSRVAQASGMGVLAPDYQSLARVPSPARQAEQIADVIDALLWLKRQGAAPIYIYGDSSGGTQVLQTLLTIARTRDEAKTAGQPDPYDGLNITAAATFSAWLDLSSSFPQYDTRQSCGGKCQGAGEATFTGYSGAVRLSSMCQAKRYSGFEKSLPVDNAVISPIDAPRALLRQLPPLMLVIGGAEVLLGENIAFAQRTQLAGGSAMVQETQGCGSKPMIEAVSAIQRVGNFFRRNESCKVTCQNMKCSGAAPVKFNFNYHELPPTTPADCQDASAS